MKKNSHVYGVTPRPGAYTQHLNHTFKLRATLSRRCLKTRKARFTKVSRSREFVKTICKFDVFVRKLLGVISRVSFWKGNTNNSFSP